MQTRLYIKESKLAIDVFFIYFYIFTHLANQVN